MTSLERKERRYQRRQSKRKLKLAIRNAELGTLADVFSFHNLFYDGLKCCRNVRWKQSTQNFERHLFSRTAKRRRSILNGTWKQGPCHHFPLSERGKTREIDAPHIDDRQVHKTETEKVLIPLYSPSLIYVNGASQKNKGLHWHFEILKKELRRHYRKHGKEGGILLIDLKGFFPNAPRAEVLKRHEKLILNPEIRALADKIVLSCPETSPGRGLPLGVEPSQQEMVALPSAIDNYVKCQLSIEMFGHYMDDYYLIHYDLEYLKFLRDKIISMFEDMGMMVNRDKCHIIPFTKPFKWCKAKFTITDTGHVIMSGNRGGMRRARRKLKKFVGEYKEGKRPYDDLIQFMESQCAYYKNYNNHARLLRLNRIFFALTGQPYICAKQRKNMLRNAA